MKQELFKELANYDQLVLICGSYEGVDERVCEHLVTREVSLGDFVLTCGEIPALALINGVIRLRPRQSVKKIRLSLKVLKMDYSTIHNIRAPLYFEIGKFLKYCDRVITKKLQNGERNNNFFVLNSADLICYSTFTL